MMPHTVPKQADEGRGGADGREEGEPPSMRRSSLFRAAAHGALEARAQLDAALAAGAALGPFALRGRGDRADEAAVAFEGDAAGSGLAARACAPAPSAR